MGERKIRLAGGFELPDYFFWVFSKKVGGFQRIETSHPTERGSAVRQCFSPGKENSYFNIASLGSALKSGAYGKRSGQGVKDSGIQLKYLKIIKSDLFAQWVILY